MTTKPKPKPLGARKRVEEFLWKNKPDENMKYLSTIEATRLVEEAEAALRKEMEKEIKKAETEICDEMREAMDCGHEQACYRSYEEINQETGEHLGTEEWCTACERQAQAVKEAVEKEREACIADARNDNLLVDDPDHPGEKMAPETWTQDAIFAKIRRRGERKLISEEEKQD